MCNAGHIPPGKPTLNTVIMLLQSKLLHIIQHRVGWVDVYWFLACIMLAGVSV